MHSILTESLKPSSFPLTGKTAISTFCDQEEEKKRIGNGRSWKKNSGAGEKEQTTSPRKRIGIPKKKGGQAWVKKGWQRIGRKRQTCNEEKEKKEGCLSLSLLGSEEPHWGKKKHAVTFLLARILKLAVANPDVCQDGTKKIKRRRGGWVTFGGGRNSRSRSNTGYSIRYSE